MKGIFKRYLEDHPELMKRKKSISEKRFGRLLISANK